MTQPARPRLGVAARIALASVAIGLLIASAAIAVGYAGLARELDRRVTDDLEARQQLIAHLLTETPSIPALRSDPHLFSDHLMGHADLHLALTEAGNGALVAAFSDVGRASVGVPAGAGAPPREWTFAGRRYDSMRSEAHTADGARVAVYVTQSRARDDQLLAAFLRASLLALPALLLLVGAGAWVTVRAGLAPLRGFNRVAASVGAQSLDRRISVEHLPAELAELGREFNRMLDRIDAGYQQLQSFAGDLAHELRTPLSILLGRTQVALSHARSEPELREVLEGNIDEFERMTRLINDVLFMARAEHGDAPLAIERVGLGGEARRVADYLSLAAEDRGVAIRVSGDAEASADRLLVQRAITNLLTNALRHANRGSTIVVEVQAEPGAALLSVANQGAPIAPEHQGHVFDRFYRADPARARSDGGAGLGLAIVKTIMDAHGGSVTLRSNPGAPTVFTLRFPA